MNIFGTEISKSDMPSYQIGSDYPFRRYQFLQDTLSMALQRQAALQQQGTVQTQPVNTPQANGGEWSK